MFTLLCQEQRVSESSPVLTDAGVEAGVCAEDVVGGEVDSVTGEAEVAAD